MLKISFLCCFPLILAAIPTGERLIHGEASIDRPSSEQIVISQHSPSAIVEWERFSIETGETARFVQPDASASILNRVTGGNLSEIYGRMEGNGRIVLINPQGVFVAETGRIDCASFVAAAFQMENRAFLEGGAAIFKGSYGANVINRGQIRAFDGPLFLIGSDVENRGELEAKDQAVFLMTGEEVAVDLLDRPHVMIRPSAASCTNSLSPYALAVHGEDAKDAGYVRKEAGRIFLDTAPERVANAAPFVTIPGAPFANPGVYVEETLDALQQLRTLIPDRLWEEEFALLVNAEGFRTLAPELAEHPRLYASQRSAVGIGASRYYFMHASISGEPIRLDDRYLEFLNSPYWKTPEALHRLYYLQRNYQKVSR